MGGPPGGVMAGLPLTSSEDSKKIEPRVCPQALLTGEKGMRPTHGVGLLGLIFYAVPALSHHGSSEYDRNTVVRYEGVVTEFLWRNPHSLLVLETQTASGEPITLEIEVAGASLLRTVGVSASSIAPGDRVTAVVSPSRRRPHESAYGYEIDKDDGSVVPVDTQNPSSRTLRQSTSDIFGTWVAIGFLDLIQARATWPLTDKGKEMFTSYSPAMSSEAHCVPSPAPWLMTQPVVYQFERSSGRVLIHVDWMGAERTIYLDGRDHPPRDRRFAQGHSIGRWEDDVLVVDTTNFTDGVRAGIAWGEERHLTERFALDEGGTTMTYSFVWEDPEYLAAPVSESAQMRYRPDLEPTNSGCDLDSAERFLREIG